MVEHPSIVILGPLAVHLIGELVIVLMKPSVRKQLGNMVCVITDLSLGWSETFESTSELRDSFDGRFTFLGNLGEVLLDVDHPRRDRCTCGSVQGPGF